MTMPEGWKASEVPKITQMPRLSLLTRPMLGLNSLDIRGYKIKAMEMKEEGTENYYPTKNFKYFEVHPIEIDYSLVFSDGVKKKGTAFSLANISNVKLTTITKGTLTKREDLILELNYLGLDRKKYIMRIDIEDKYADEIVKLIRSSQKLETDSNYWTHQSLKFTTQDGQINRIDIYLLTPFLAAGEQIVWYIQRYDVNDKKKKIIGIDAVTNYRVFQYKYEEHTGAAILFPSVEDVRITNEARGASAGRYNSSSPHLTGIGVSVLTDIMGDISFYYRGSPVVTFIQVADPETLSMVVRTLNKRLGDTSMRDGDMEPKSLDQPKIETLPTYNINQKATPICTKCNNKGNPVGSKFCNKCGSPLSAACPKCGNSNPTEAIFCGQCGSKLNVSVAVPDLPNSPSESMEDRVLEHNFLEYTLPERGIKINYPATWTKTEDVTDTFTSVMFFSPKEDLNDIFLDGLGILVQDLPPNTTLKDYVEAGLQDFQKNAAHFVLIESIPTTLAGLPAHQHIYTEGGFKTLYLAVIRENKGYSIMYKAQSNKYVKFLSIAEQMISSFEFMK